MHMVDPKYKLNNTYNIFIIALDMEFGITNLL